MDFRILGPLEVIDPDGCRVDLGAPRQRAVLAVLLVLLNQVVSIDRLIDELWGETPPGAATASLQAYVSNLRRVLEPDRIAARPAKVVVTEAPGYALRVAPDQRRCRTGSSDSPPRRTAPSRAAMRPARCARSTPPSPFGAAPAYAEFAYQPFATPEISRLHELRAAAEEDRVESRLLIGDGPGALAALGPLVAASPLRERLRALKMRVLYRAGRQAEALRTYDEARRLLAEELGLEPGRELQTAAPPDAGAGPGAGHRRRTSRPSAARDDRHPRLHRTPRRGGRSSSVAPTPCDRLRARDGRGGGRTHPHRAGRRRARHRQEPPRLPSWQTLPRQAGIPTCWGRCHDDEGAPPLWPWVQVLRALGVGDLQTAAPPFRPRRAAPGARAGDPRRPRRRCRSLPPLRRRTRGHRTGRRRTARRSSSSTTSTGPTLRRCASCGSSPSSCATQRSSSS